MSHFRTKQCACGCGRVGEFAQYATAACRQRAYRQRKKEYNTVKAQSVSGWIIDMFGEDDAQNVFSHLNELKGEENIKRATAALEQLVYLMEAKIRREKSKVRRVK